MNQVSEVVRYIKSLCNADSLVNYVHYGSFDEVDVNKMTLPIIVNIEIVGGSFPENVTSLEMQIACLAQRDLTHEVNTDTFIGNDNFIDNQNETLAVLNRLWLTMRKDFEKINITASEAPSFEPIVHDTVKILDGWLLSLTVELPNTIISLCP